MLFIFSLFSLLKQTFPVSLVTPHLWSAVPFTPNIPFTSLKPSWALSEHWMSGPVEVGTFLAPHCYFQIILPLPSSKNHCSFNADVIWIYHYFLFLVTTSHSPVFCSILFLYPWWFQYLSGWPSKIPSLTVLWFPYSIDIFLFQLQSPTQFMVIS